MLQGGEVIIILILALVVLGPSRLPEVARKLGKWTAELRASAREVRRGLEAEVADLKQPIEDIKRDIEGSGLGGLEWTGPKPVSGPTPEDAMADLERISEELDEEVDEELDEEGEKEGGA